MPNMSHQLKAEDVRTMKGLFNKLTMGDSPDDAQRTKDHDMIYDDTMK